MEKEKIAVIILGIILAGALFTFFVVEYGDEIGLNVFGNEKEQQEKQELIAKDDIFTVYLGDVNKTLEILNNDIYPDDLENLTINVTDPNHGAVNIVENSLSYTAEEGYVGYDEIEYTIEYDGKIVSAKINLTIEEKYVEFGDFVSFNYIEYIYHNETNKEVHSSSYENISEKTNGTPVNLYIGQNASESSPNWFYTNLFNGTYVKGLVEGLIDMKEGGKKMIGPLSVNDAYGVGLSEDDFFTTSSLAYGLNMSVEVTDLDNKNLSLKWIDIESISDFTMPMYIIDNLHNDLQTDDAIFPPPYYIWDGQTEISEINEDSIEIYTTPDTTTNLVESIELVQFGNDNSFIFPDASTATYTDDLITITHNPEINSTYVYSLSIYGQNVELNLKVENISGDIINVSAEYMGQKSYEEINTSFSFNRTYQIPRNYIIPLSEAGAIGLKDEINNFGYSIHPLADQQVMYYVEIESINKSD